MVKCPTELFQKKCKMASHLEPDTQYDIEEKNISIEKDKD